MINLAITIFGSIFENNSVARGVLFIPILDVRRGDIKVFKLQNL